MSATSIICLHFFCQLEEVLLVGGGSAAAACIAGDAAAGNVACTNALVHRGGTDSLLVCVGYVCHTTVIACTPESLFVFVC